MPNTGAAQKPPAFAAASDPEQIRSRIDQNIRHSFHAFKDHDHDGHADDD